MSITTFLLRAMGKAPDQLEVQRQFEESLKKVAEQENVLDGILEDLDKINSCTRKKSERLSAIHRSISEGLRLPTHGMPATEK